MAAPSRHLRVFLSSTFRDMQAERDHLARHVFPVLRKLCESRGATFTEVDLRWGITDEDAAREGVLGICLNEIDRCRPYFIGLLGDRYGTVAERIPDTLAEDEPWLLEYRERSITEIEILHGVLRRPAGEVDASFYLRKPAAASSAGPEDSRITALKDRIRDAAAEGRVRLRENYRSVEELGAWVADELTRIIEQRFPPADVPSAIDRELQEHEAFAQNRADVYVRRGDLHDRLTTAAADSSGHGLIVIGDAGAGKSALLANWSNEYAAAHPDEFVFTHFVGATSQSADWTALLRRIIAALRTRFDVPGGIGESPETLRASFATCLSEAAARGRIVLVLDGLDRLEDRDGALDLVWLPDPLPRGVLVVASALPSRPLDVLRERGWPSLQITPLDLNGREQLIRDYLARYTKRLADTASRNIAEQPQCGNPRFLRTLLEELRIFGLHHELGARIDYYLSAATPRELYGLILRRYEEDYDAARALVSNAFSLLWAARRGLSETELLALLGSKESPLPHARWAPLLIAAEHSLIDRSGLLTFANDDLREAVASRYLSSEDARHAVRLRLVEHFYEPEALGPRHREELTWQLYENGAWEWLADLLADPAFFLALWIDDEFEARRYWAELESHGQSMLNAYAPVVEEPTSHPQLAFALSQLFETRGYRADAVSLLEKLIAHFRAIGDARSLQACMVNLAVLTRGSGDLDRSAALAAEQRELSEAEGNEVQLARSLINQAQVAAARKDTAEAMALLKQAEAIAIRIGRDDVLAPCLGEQAMLLFAGGRLREALELQRRVESLARGTANAESLGAALGNQAFILRQLGDLDAAAERFEKALETFRSIGDRVEVQRSLFNRAMVLAQLRRFREALPLFEELETVSRDLNDLRNTCEALYRQAMVLHELGNHREKQRRLEKLESLRPT